MCELWIGAVHKQRQQLGGGLVKKLSKLPLDSTKELSIWWKGVSKKQKKIPTLFMDGLILYE